MDNAGTFIKRGAGTTTAINNPIPFNSTGSVVLEAGALSLNASASLGGTWDLSGSDDLRLNSATYTLLPGVNLPRIVLTASTLSVPFDYTVPRLVVQSDSRVSVASGNALTVSGTFDYSAGTITANGRVIVASGASANLTTGSAKFIDGVLENRGTLNYTGTSIFFGRDASNLPARIENAANGTFVVDGGGGFSQNNGSANYRVDNAGTFIKRGAGTTTVVGAPISFSNTGTVQMAAGALQFSGALTQNGIITGSGTIIANITNNGTVRPDATPGGLTIQGNYTQTAAGRLEMRLAGADATLGHRSLTITGAAVFAGALDVTLVFPFVELLNTTFPIVTYASRSGDFATVTGLTNNFGYTFSRAFTGTALNLTVDVQGDVPPPPGGLESGFAHWLAEAAARAGRSDQLGQGDDPDGDGAVNLLEYASGTNPFEAASAPLITPGLVEEGGEKRAVLEFRRRTDTGTIAYQVLESRDLATWSLVAGMEELSAVPVPGLPLETVRMAMPGTLPGSTGYFLRLRVEQQSAGAARAVAHPPRIKPARRPAPANAGRRIPNPGR